MNVLFECRAIPANNSCGIENYTYSVVKSLARCFPETTIYCSVAAWEYQQYNKLLNVEGLPNIKLVYDPLQGRMYELTRKSWIIKISFYLLRKLFPSLKRMYLGERRKWVGEIENEVDVVVYPYHRDPIIQREKPVILISHDFYDFDHDQGLDRKNRKLVTRNIEKAQAVVTSWPEPFEQLRRRFPSKHESSYMIPFLVDRPDYSFVQSDLKVARQLMYAGSSAVHKNHINLIKALGILKRSGEEKIRILCPGRLDENREKILETIKAENVDGWIQFMGYIERERLIRLYAESVGVIAPTKYEAFSGTVMEGLQAGLPIACSDIPQLRILIDEYLNIKVRYFDPDSPEEIAEGIIDILNHYDFYSAESRKSHLYLDTLTEQFVAERYWDVFSNILNHSNRS